MKKFLSILTLILVPIYFIGCSSSASTEGGDIPEWYLKTPEDPNYFFAVATSVSKDLQLSVDKATTDARADIFDTGQQLAGNSVSAICSHDHFSDVLRVEVPVRSRKTG